MIKASAPCRISLFGSGTDTGEYAEKYGGLCINFAINIRQIIELDDSKSDIELLPSDSRLFFSYFLQNNIFIGIKHQFNCETRSGLGSSASLAVTLMSAVTELDGIKLSKEQIAEEAWNIEVNKLGLFGGKQDQYCASFGGFNKMEFTKDDVIVTPLPRKWINKLYPYMVLLNSGIKRTNPKLQEGLKLITKAQKDTLDKIKEIAKLSIEPLEKGDIEEIGKLLSESWKLKKQSNKGVSNSQIDDLYNYGIELGAIGGKVLGSGGGGCLFFLVEPNKQKEFIESMELKQIPFEIDWEGVKTETI